MHAIYDKGCPNSNDEKPANDSSQPAAPSGGEPEHNRDDHCRNEDGVTTRVRRIDLRWVVRERQKRRIRAVPIHRELHDRRRKPRRGDGRREGGRDPKVASQRDNDSRKNDRADDGRAGSEDLVNGAGQGADRAVMEAVEEAHDRKVEVMDRMTSPKTTTKPMPMAAVQMIRAR